MTIDYPDRRGCRPWWKNCVNREVICISFTVNYWQSTLCGSNETALVRYSYDLNRHDEQFCSICILYNERIKSFEIVKPNLFNRVIFPGGVSEQPMWKEGDLQHFTAACDVLTDCTKHGCLPFISEREIWSPRKALTMLAMLVSVSQSVSQFQFISSIHLK